VIFFAEFKRAFEALLTVAWPLPIGRWRQLRL